jgi:hypothetical protein
MSLNPITPNTPTGAQGYTATTRNIDSGFIKRSQSVRTNKNRKVSWNSAPDKQRAVSIHDYAENKENDTIGEVNSEDELNEDDEDAVSESGTVDRRTSQTTDGESRPTSSYAGSVSEDSERPTSSGTMTGSEVSGSYVTGSEISDRRTSYASTLRSTLGADTIIDEEDEDGSEAGTEVHYDEDASAEAGAEESEAEITIQRTHSGLARKNMVIYAAPSDSGLGTDLPTATMSGCETDYFRRKAEE